MEELDFEAWLKLGYDNGWIGAPVCETHDGLPMSETEQDAFETDDPCIHILRLYDSTEHKSDVEANHGPSVWRASNRGF